jgi:outer membrane protein
MNTQIGRSRANALFASIIAVAGLAVSGAGLAEDYKIGVINTDRILRESAPAKEAAKKLEQEFQSREAEIGRLDRELRDLATRYDRDAATTTEAERNSRQREIDARSRDLERMRRQVGEDLKARQFDEMNKIKERLDTVLTKLAKDQNYDLILQDGLFVRRTVDITDAVIKALDTK